MPMKLHIDPEWCLAAAKREAEFGGECGAGAIARDPVERCPTCDSPQPHLHPAVQHEGEVQICNDPWHKE